MYEDAKRHNVVFVGRDRSGTTKYAHARNSRSAQTVLAVSIRGQRQLALCL
nr:DUF3991 domain-containing protein [Alloscardovia theropitheci]